MAIEKGNSNAMNNYVIMLFKGKGTLVNKEEAAKYFKKAINNGNYLSTNNNVINVINLAESAKDYKKSTDKENDYKNVFKLKKGKGTPMKNEEAAEYYKMAIEKGKTNALTNYAKALYDNKGIEVNKEEAIQKKNNASSMFNYGCILNNNEESMQKRYNKGEQ